jgi:hypothetical protein
MMDASICGLGQAAPNPVLTVLKYFPESVMPVSFSLNGTTVAGRADDPPDRAAWRRSTPRYGRHEA